MRVCHPPRLSFSLPSLSFKEYSSRTVSYYYHFCSAGESTVPPISQLSLHAQSKNAFTYASWDSSTTLTSSGSVGDAGGDAAAVAATTASVNSSFWFFTFVRFWAFNVLSYTAPLSQCRCSSAGKSSNPDYELASIASHGSNGYDSVSSCFYEGLLVFRTVHHGLPSSCSSCFSLLWRLASLRAALRYSG